VFIVVVLRQAVSIMTIAQIMLANPVALNIPFDCMYFFSFMMKCSYNSVIISSMRAIKQRYDYAGMVVACAIGSAIHKRQQVKNTAEYISYIVYNTIACISM
jgi:hypothetical protein